MGKNDKVFTELMEQSTLKISQLDELTSKLNFIMSEIPPDYQINIKFKILHARTDLYQVYNEAKIDGIHEFGTDSPTLLNIRYVFKQVDELLDEIKTII